MSHSWFLHTGELVSGPFTTDEVNNLVMSGRIPPSATIWWKGQREWLPLSFWREHVHEILRSVAEQTGNAIWFFEEAGAAMGVERGPFTQAGLVDQLKSIDDLNSVRVWARGSEKRRNPYEMHDLMEQIGKNRREHERTPLTGWVGVTLAKNHLLTAKLKVFSISAGGLGIVGRHEYRAKDVVTLVLDSPELGRTFSARATVAYVTEQGYTGLKFSNVSAELSSAIEAYLARFAPRARVAA